MADVELSCGLPPGPDFADLALLAEQSGYARVWIFDSAPFYEDPFVHLALAAERTARIGLAAGVLIPAQRSVMAMASGIATIARLAGDRFRACFGTGGSARLALGQRPMTLNELFEYVATLRTLLAGGTAVVDGQPVAMMHWPGMTADRPVHVPLWLSVMGPRGNARAHEVADGIIGLPHPRLPTATMVSGTVLDPGERPRSDRVLRAVGPWGVVGWHHAYASAGAGAVDAMPGGAEWRRALEMLAPEGKRQLLAYEGHVTHLTDRDLPLLDHLDVEARTSNVLGMKVGDADFIRGELDKLSDAGYCEVMYNPSGPDVARELRAFAAAAG